MRAEPNSGDTGFNFDHFDDLCRYMMVNDTNNDKVIATTRILTNENAASAGGFYSETEFYFGEVLAIDKKFIEIGRTCVHTDYRNSPAIDHL